MNLLDSEKCITEKIIQHAQVEKAVKPVVSSDYNGGNREHKSLILAEQLNPEQVVIRHTESLQYARIGLQWSHSGPRQLPRMGQSQVPNSGRSWTRGHG